MMIFRRNYLLGGIATVALGLAPNGTARAQTEADWPHTLSENGATVVVYQPQAISWPEYGTLTAQAALAITPAGVKSPILGTVRLTFATQTDPVTRMVTLSDPKLAASHFPSLDTTQASQLEQKIRAALPTLALKQVPLVSITTSLTDNAAPAAAPVNNDPPQIFHASRPASLVVFDGDPVLAPVAATGLSYVVNTNWPVFSDPVDRRWFLLNNGVWFAAPAATGPYAAISKLPASFNAMPSEGDYAFVRRSIPARAMNAAQAPTIFVTSKPAELIVTQGPPRLLPVKGTGLQQVANSNATLLFDSRTGTYYYLTSGRWFAARGLDGPWSFATPDLPADFALIPPASQAGAVLPSVPGTAQAQQAVLEAQVPKQSILRRDVAKPEVTYAGSPEFKDIPGTQVAYAVNTSDQVLRVEGKFYLCYQGAWFVAPAATGPWMLADSLPEAISAIPPSSPVYNVTYVKVQSATPQTVTYAYTAGYALGFVAAGVLVYGTGYYYAPVVVPGRVPAYFPYPYTYAGGTYYNPASGAWGRGGAVYGPYGGVARGGNYYNPSTGAYAQAGAIYGPNGGVGGWSTYNPNTGISRQGSASWNSQGGTAYGQSYNSRTGVSTNTTQNVNQNGRWGSSQASGPNQTVNTASGSNARGSAGGFTSSTGAQGAAVHGRNGNGAAVVQGQGGDIYAGHDGNVYRHTDDGWSQWNNGSWNQVQRPTRAGGSQAGGASRGQLSQRDYSGLEQDRQGRTFGMGSIGGGFRSSGGGRRFR